MSEWKDPSRTELRSFPRRELLGGIAASGAAVIAGCSDDSSSEGNANDTRNEREESSGQTYTFMARMDPTDMNWLNPPNPLETLLYPPGQTLDPARDVISHTVESMEIGSNRALLRLREGATWSNDEPILAEDLGKFLELNRVLGPDPEKVRDGQITPANWQFGITDIEWNDRELVLRSPDGLLRKLASQYDVWAFLNNEVGVRSRFYYDSIWSEYRERYENPWESEERHNEARSYIRSTIHNPILIADGLRDWENVVSSGPWKLDSVGANRVSLVPHDGHPLMPDGTDFQKLTIRPTSNIQKAAASLKAGNGDAFQPKIGPTNRFFPPSVAREIPDEVRRFDAKAMSGEGLIFNHGEHDLLADRRVRAAFMYAIDRSQTATNAHEIGTPPVDVPGLDPIDDPQYSSDVVSGLLNYEKDTGKAARLLRDAGLTKPNETWKAPDGSDFEVPILTVQQASIDKPGPLMTQSIESQLQSFGIQAQMVPLEQSSASEKLRSGDFAAVAYSWPIVLRNGQLYNRAAVRYASSVGFKFNMRPQLRFFEEDLEAIVEASDGISWTIPDNQSMSGITVNDPEPLKQITVEAPPVGEPDGQLKEHPAVYLAVKAVTDWAWEGQESNRKEAIEKLLWVYNYDLPHLEIARTVPQIYHNIARWDIPDADDEIWRYNGPGAYSSSIEGALLHGKISAK